MNAKEFCEMKDKDVGEAWSNDYEELPKAMEEYHQMKLQEMITMEHLLNQKNIT